MCGRVIVVAPDCDWLVGDDKVVAGSAGGVSCLSFSLIPLVRATEADDEIHDVPLRLFQGQERGACAYCLVVGVGRDVEHRSSGARRHDRSGPVGCDEGAYAGYKLGGAADDEGWYGPPEFAAADLLEELEDVLGSDHLTVEG